MDTERLRYFLAIARLGSLAEASKVLGVSSPALSKAMRVFEGEVGAPLFLRDGRRLALSTEGKRLVPQVEEAWRRIAELRTNARAQAASEKSIVRLATFEIFSTHFLGPLVTALPRDAELELHEALPSEIERLVAEGLADLGLTYLPIPHGGVEFLEIVTINMGVFGRKDRFDGRELELLPFAVPLGPVTGVPSRARGLDGWPDDRLPRWRRYRVSMMESALELCRQGLAVAYLPSFIVRLHNQTVAREHRLEEVWRSKLKDGRQSVYLVKPRQDRESRLARRLAGVVRRTCRA